MPTKQLFCGKCNNTTTFGLSVEKNEFIATCQVEGCGHALKFPATRDRAEFLAWLDQHNADNHPVAPAAPEQAADPELESLLTSL